MEDVVKDVRKLKGFELYGTKKTGTKKVGLQV